MEDKKDKLIEILLEKIIELSDRLANSNNCKGCYYPCYPWYPTWINTTGDDNWIITYKDGSFTTTRNTSSTAGDVDGQ